MKIMLPKSILVQLIGVFQRLGGNLREETAKLKFNNLDVFHEK